MNHRESPPNETDQPIAVTKFIVPSGMLLGAGPAWRRTVFVDRLANQIFIPVFFGNEDTERALVAVATACGAPMLADKHTYLPLEFYEIAYPEFAAVWSALRCNVAANMDQKLPIDRN